MKFEILPLIAMVLLSTVSCASISEHKIVKRQIGLPLGVAGLGGQMGFGGIQNGFAGIHSGPYGGLIGSPVFGPGGIGPFNNPNARNRRIDQLVNINRRIQGELPLRSRPIV